ncbi:MAG: MgtC/SapB family protein [Bacteroidales bacterium]|nr:MgtC/SapB family protein [Bacteroidales bacterium]MBQ1709261.1 MgtC/SapB family protein [Bacteroidales bacterium]MBQ2598410.1 MgtC/SapB family protein [Bacteroidales bacterium]MBQ4013069.1 MgtC/SapB family protein [Bacteroidales bacterium]
MTDFLKETFDISNLFPFCFDLVLVLLIGWLVGHERHEAGKTMGERSTIILIIGSYLFAYASLRCGIDHSRVIAQIVTGVGFIGAGIILKRGEKDIINLTTAILVWTIAALGVLVGIGLRVEAILAAVVVYFVLRIRRRRETNHNNQAEEKEHV